VGVRARFNSRKAAVRVEFRRRMHWIGQRDRCGRTAVEAGAQGIARKGGGRCIQLHERRNPNPPRSDSRATLLMPSGAALTCRICVVDHSVYYGAEPHGEERPTSMAMDVEESNCDAQWEAGYYECELEWRKPHPHPSVRGCNTIDECAAMYVTQACGGTGMTSARQKDLR